MTAQEFPTAFRHAFTAAGPVRALLDVSGFSLTVRASDSPEITVEVAAHRDREADLDLLERTDVEFAGDRLVVRSERGTFSRLRTLFGGGPRVDVRIGLPSGSSLEVRGWGDVRAAGVLGVVDIDSSAGNVDLEEVGALRVRVSAGDVRVGVVTGSGDVHSSAGNIRVGTAHDTLSARTSAGDVVVDRAHGSSRLATSAGDVRVADATGSVHARTSAGDVRLDRVSSGSVDLESSYGRLTVGVVAGTAAWLDVHARHGSVRSDLSATDGPGDAERTVEIRAVASYGDVVLHRV